MNQTKDDDHSEGQEETRGSKMCCVVQLIKAFMAMIDYQGDDSSKRSNLLL